MIVTRSKWKQFLSLKNTIRHLTTVIYQFPTMNDG